MLSLMKFGKMKSGFIHTSRLKIKHDVSKTQRKRLQQEDALSKNNGHDVRYRKRLMDEQEAYEELKRSLKELENKDGIDRSVQE